MNEFRGNLYVFVDPVMDAVASAADELGIFGSYGPGDVAWFMTGKAVGRNGRGSHCARTSTSRLRRFATFAEAMSYVHDKRKSRPQEMFYLVYESDGRKSIITSLEQIQRMDGCTVGIEADTETDDGEHGHFDLLAAKVGKIVATNALILLRTWSKEGESVARERFSPATYERLWGVLSEARLVGDGA